ncbi:hypothetical protein [Streptomyces harbinensis]|uniref:Uncharacterized protein n=1 Tax=Streptomyces harbinensis TaxID=1176198 RepID=A0A1I6WDJ2_9ACTN|nr:hypothetical protein [Streptomyces harbinensis]SFT23624.1 hypothetical protein SAMN05444716_11915 [Streptomyces harbinensis]
MSAELIKAHRLSGPMMAALHNASTDNGRVTGRTGTLVALITRGLITTATAATGREHLLTELGAEVLSGLLGTTVTTPAPVAADLPMPRGIIEPGARVRVPLGRAVVTEVDDDYVSMRFDGGAEGSIAADSLHIYRLCIVCDQVGDASMPGDGRTCGYCLATAEDDAARAADADPAPAAPTEEGASREIMIGGPFAGPALVVRADQVRDDDLIMAAFPAGTTVDAAISGREIPHATPVLAAPAAFDVGCWCGACKEYAHRCTAPAVVLARTTPWGTCAVVSAGDPVAVRRPVSVTTDRGPVSDWWVITTRAGAEVARVQAADYAAVTRAAEQLPEVTAVSRREGGYSVRRLFAAEAATPGCRPAHAAHPDVRAALEALTNLRLARLQDDTETHRTADEIDASVTGLMVEPRGRGRVAAYWMVEGMHTTPEGEAHRAQLDIIRAKFREAGWAVELGSLTCVFAWRPDRTDAELRATEAASYAQMRKEINASRCVHGRAPAEEVYGAPAAACARKEPTQRVGVFGDDGCLYIADCAVEAAMEAVSLTEAEHDGPEYPAAAPPYVWHVLCPIHEDQEQRADACEYCLA